MPLKAPWESLLKAHRQSQRHRPGIGYNHLKHGNPSGLEWMCIGTQLPQQAHIHGAPALKHLLKQLTASWNPNSDWTDSIVSCSQAQWDTLKVKRLSYNSTIQISKYFFQPRAISERGFVHSETLNRYVPPKGDPDACELRQINLDRLQKQVASILLPPLDQARDLHQPKVPIQHQSSLRPDDESIWHDPNDLAGPGWHGVGPWNWGNGDQPQPGECTPPYAETDAAELADTVARQLPLREREPRIDSHIATDDMLQQVSESAHRKAAQEFLARELPQARKLAELTAQITDIPGEDRMQSTDIPPRIKRPRSLQRSNTQVYNCEGQTPQPEAQDAVPCVAALPVCFRCHGTNDQDQMMKCDNDDCTMAVHICCEHTPGSQVATDCEGDMSWFCDTCFRGPIPGLTGSSRLDASVAAGGRGAKHKVPVLE